MRLTPAQLKDIHDILSTCRDKKTKMFGALAISDAYIAGIKSVREPVKPDTDAVHNWFGLTYAKWLTIPRVIMSQMSDEWQTEFVDLLDKLFATFDWIPEDTVFYVSARDTRTGRHKELPEVLCNYRHPNYKELEKMKP